MEYNPTRKDQRLTTREQSMKTSDGSWKPEVKLDAVKTYVSLGCNMSATAEVLGIGRSTLIKWATTDWWKDTLHELKMQDNIELSGKLGVIVQRALTIMEDRVSNGDFFFNPNKGCVERKPVSLRDASAVFNDGLKQREILTRTPEERQAAESINDKLANLAKQFEQFAAQQKVRPAVTVTDVVYITNEDSVE